MKILTLAIVASLISVRGINASTEPPLPQTADQFAALERDWAAAIQKQDVASMERFLSPQYSLFIAVQGERLKVIPRAAWLDTLKVYETKAFTIDDLQAHAYGDTAIVLMLCTQQATVKGQDRSGQFLITDVWVKGASGWRVTERHSSRPEPKMAARP
jgi:ketosteroid isomerase-like protein